MGGIGKISDEKMAYENLANAIVILAAKDYRTALKRQKKKPTVMNDYEVCKLERFFRSEWYHALTSVDGEFLIEQIRKELE